jgi:hypothetical protein
VVAVTSIAAKTGSTVAAVAAAYKLELFPDQCTPRPTTLVAAASNLEHTPWPTIAATT